MNILYVMIYGSRESMYDGGVTAFVGKDRRNVADRAIAKIRSAGLVIDDDIKSQLNGWIEHNCQIIGTCGNFSLFSEKCKIVEV